MDLVRLDHGLQHVVHGHGFALASEVISDGKDGTEVVRGVSPFRSEEAIVVVQPPDLSANVECTTDRVELVVRPRNLRAYET